MCDSECDDFASFCKFTDENLRGSYAKYEFIFSKKILEAMKHALFSLNNKEICISVFGRHNSGKSTFLNGLLGNNYLPTRRTNETSVSIKIQHDNDVHDGACLKDCPQTRHKTCPRLIVTKKNGKKKVHFGLKAIQDQLRNCNRKARKNPEKIPQEVILKVNFPLLVENIPVGWTVSLVDNPGFADAKEHISQLAESSVVTSAAYIYIIETEGIEGQEGGSAFKRLADQDPECFTDDRLVIAVSKFDCNYEDMTMENEDFVDEKEVTKSICEQIRSATGNKFHFQEGNVFPVSGKWAVHRSNLANCPNSDKEEYDACFDTAVKSLKLYPKLSDLPSGEGQGDVSQLPPGEMLRQMDTASGLPVVRERIRFMVSKACVKIWGQKLLSEYSRFIKEAVDNIRKEVQELKKSVKEKERRYETQNQNYSNIVFRRNNLESFTDEDNEQQNLVWQELDQNYSKELEASKAQCDITKRAVRSLAEEFKTKCLDRFRTEGDHFGPPEFEKDLNTFLENASKTLEKSFENFRFSHLQTIILNGIVSVTKDFGDIAESANYLFNYEKFDKDSYDHDATMALHESIRGQAKRKVFEARQKFQAPSDIKEISEKVSIPPVSLSLWKRIKTWFMSKLHVSSSSEDDAEDLPYRLWSDVEGTIESIKKMLDKDCDDYVGSIKPYIIKFYHSQYVQATKEQLEEFDGTYGKRLQEEKLKLEELKESLEIDGEKVSQLRNEKKQLQSLQEGLMRHYQKQFERLCDPPFITSS